MLVENLKKLSNLRIVYMVGKNKERKRQRKMEKKVQLDQNNDTELKFDAPFRV